MKIAKIKPKLSRLLLSSLALLILSFPLYSVSGEDAPTQVSIDDVEVVLENRTGMIYFLFQVRGSAPPGTDHVNATFGYSNSTDREILDLWIEEIDAVIFGNGISLLPKGPDGDPWSSYIFSASLFLPYNGNLSFTFDLLMDIVGELGGNLSGKDGTMDEELDPFLINVTDPTALLEGVDPLEILSMLQDTEILFVARAVDQDGNYTEAERDVKMELIDAVFGFLEDEGMVEPFVQDQVGPHGEDDGDEGPGDGKDAVSSPLVEVLVYTGLVLILVSVLIMMIWLLLVRRKG